MFDTNPTETLRGKIELLVSKIEKPPMSDLVQVVFLGLEVRNHPEFADMEYVMSKTHETELDRGNRIRLMAVDMWVSAYYDNPKSLDRELVKRRIYDNATAESI